MHRQLRRRLLIGVVVAIGVAAIAVVVVRLRPESDEKPPSNSIRSDIAAKIRSHGVTLAAEVITPKGHGPTPLLVMPAAWASPPTALRAIGLQFARAGYQVVAYAQRGFGGSTGKVDFAGRGSQRDASSVISWALKHTRGDPDHIGMLGLSYGAGIGLLAAAHDRRIEAVAALSTWADVGDTFEMHGTPATGALGALIGGPVHRPSFDRTVRHLESVLANHPAAVGTATQRISPSRSPSDVIDKLNKNKPAIMIANAFEDSIFNAAQLVPFFAALTTPKRLELAGGDHGAPERSALSGAPNGTLNDVHAWFDHYLRGAANGVDQEAPIVMKDVRSGELHTYQTWPIAKASDRAPLGPPSAAAQTDNPSTTWTATINAGVDSAATSGPMQFVPSTAYRPPTATMKSIRATDAFVWAGPGLINGLGLRGTPSVQVGLAASKPTATIYVYLYDVGSDGVGTLIDMQPYTATDLLPKKAKYVTIGLQPTCWSVPSGHRLTLVIDTVDPRFESLTARNTTITVTSTKKLPAGFTAPSAA